MRVETLEDRCTPAVFHVTLATDNAAAYSAAAPFGPGQAGDLRNAIDLALQNPSDQDVIDFTGISGNTIALSAMLPPLYSTGTGSITIAGPGAGSLTIDGGACTARSSSSRAR